MYVGTTEPLFFKAADPHSLFEKEASIAKMPDDEKKWPAHILSEIHKSLPFISAYDLDIVLDRMEPEAGAALGFVMVRNKSVANRPVDDVSKASNRVRVPVVIIDRQLQPFHTFEVGGNIYPLTADRMGQAMLNPGIFDAAVESVPQAPSLVDQLSPPYQQRQGFGRIAEPNAAGIAGVGKMASAMSKEAVEVRDLEKHLGVLLRGKADSDARQHLEKAKNESFVLQHPILTGIPTLGIAPLLMRHRALENAKYELMKAHPGLHKAIIRAEEKRKQERAEEFERETRRASATQTERAVAHAAAAGLAGLSMHHRHQKEQQERLNRDSATASRMHQSFADMQQSLSDMHHMHMASAADAPNYHQASGVNKCASCKWFRGSETSPGQCAKFDFQALPHFVCDAWTAATPGKEASAHVLSPFFSGTGYTQEGLQKNASFKKAVSLTEKIASIRRSK